MTLLLALWLAFDGLQGQGSIRGQVLRPDGAPVPGVMVLLQDTGDIQWSGPDGRYAFARLEPGSYTLVLTLGGYTATEKATVAAGEAALLDTKVDWPLSFVEALVVTTASRHVESIADAPALVSLIDSATIARRSGSNQLPMLLASAPGVHAPQSGLYDINLNARGFNDFVNRAVRTEIDGREASMPQVMGYTDWASLPFGLDEVDRIEFLNGPGGALYGVGALDGVLSIRTKSPETSLGGRARFTVGGLGTTRVDARQAVALGGGWFLKALGGYQRSDDFAQSRNTSVEYAPDRLQLEAVPLSGDKAELAYGSARIDRRFASGGLLTAEGGTAWKRGQVSLTSLGRYQATGSTFPWARGAFESPRWTLHAGLTTANVDNQVGLASGEATFQQASNLEVDARTHRAFAGGVGHWVGGASYARQRVDSANEQGIQTNYEHPETADSGSFYGQVDYAFAGKWRASLAGRLDMSSLSGATLSPRTALVYEITPGRRARVAFSRAFKAPTIAGLRLRAPIAPPLDLSGIEDALRPLLGGTSLGFASVPLLAVGNEALEAEDVSSIEAGYNTLVGGRAFLQATYYWSHRNRFTSGLLPQLGTSLGRLNPSFGPYQAPSSLSPLAAGAVYAALDAALPPTLRPFLSNSDTGAPVFALATFANFAAADAQGLDMSGTIKLDDRWQIDASYSWFDASVQDQPPDVPLLPNTPRHQGSVGAQYVSPRVDVSLRARVVEGFDWVSGVFSGPVPAYGVVDAQVNVPLTRQLTLGVDVANVLDHRHYEMFGGDLLGRRALAHVTAGW
jgi:outer membrane receptor protein involved in Fe transport